MLPLIQFKSQNFDLDDSNFIHEDQNQHRDNKLNVSIEAPVKNVHIKTDSDLKLNIRDRTGKTLVSFTTIVS